MKIIILLALAIVSAPVAAEELSVNQPNDQETRIAVDEESGEIRFIINGVEQARLTSDGLLVRESIEYGGSITDIGTASFDVRFKAKEEVSDAP